jgi:alpha-beta hydrolase superfamily lysophospholipase
MKTPVMMVHGMCCTGEVWSSFRTFFEERGTRVYTPTLRADARTSIRDKPSVALRALRFGDYVSDHVREAKRIEVETGRKPAVIGHSMGGLLAQAMAQRDCVSAAVWISPAPSAGTHDLQSGLFWFAVRAAHALRVAPLAIKPARKAIFTQVFNALPEADREAAYNAMVYESGPAFAAMGSWPIDASQVRVPVLTVAATRDKLVPAKLVRLAARKYAAVGGEFREYADHGHWLYAEPGWEQPATDIYAWLSAATQHLDASEPPARDLSAEQAEIRV